MTITTYQFATGYNNSGSLADIVPQPKTPGLLYPETLYAINGNLFYNGFATVDFTFTLLTVSEWNSLNTFFGLTDSIPSVEGIFTIKKSNRIFSTFNGIIHRPLATWNYNLNANTFIYTVVNIRSAPSS